MTQLATARTAARTGPRRQPAPRRLRVVAPPPAAGSGLFLGLCVLLLFGGFVGVLVLNTSMAKGSFILKDLQRRSDALADTQDDLRHALDEVSGPGPLASRARSLGMVPAQSPAFLRLADGSVLGVATRATKDEAFSVVTESQTVSRGVPVPTARTTPATKAPAAPTKTSTTTTTKAPTKKSTPRTPSPRATGN
jgi:hypothetical protein